MRLGQALSAPISSKVAPRLALMEVAAMTRENEQLRFVTEELHHRIKNLVAVIQSIARQTMQQSDDVNRFSGRLGALARSLDLLIDANWNGAPIDEIVRQQLAPFGDDISISAEGPPVSLSPEAARNIGFALHELATNASKYGALSVPEGRVTLYWKLIGSGATQSLRMAWREFGGPAVTEPKRWGFGRQVIARITAQSLEATVKHEFRPDGVRWTLDIPAASVVTASIEGTRTGPHHRVQRH
jgi:two-component sensor histidine kinase